MKHRLVEGMGSATADALGLSRAILCNDALVQKLTALQQTEGLYKGLVTHAKSTLHAFYDLMQIYKSKYFSHESFCFNASNILISIITQQLSEMHLLPLVSENRSQERARRFDSLASNTGKWKSTE